MLGFCLLHFLFGLMLICCVFLFRLCRVILRLTVTMSKQTTRATTSHTVFGSPVSELPLSELRTHLQVARHFLFLEENKYTSKKEVIPELAQAFAGLWNRASIPVQPIKNVKTKLLQLWKKVHMFRSKTSRPQNTKKFVGRLSQLFDIAECQCHDLSARHCEKI